MALLCFSKIQQILSSFPPFRLVSNKIFILFCLVWENLFGTVYLSVSHMVGCRYPRSPRPFAGLPGAQRHSHFFHLRLCRARDSQHHFNSQDLLHSKRVETLPQKSPSLFADSFAVRFRLRYAVKSIRASAAVTLR